MNEDVTQEELEAVGYYPPYDRVDLFLFDGDTSVDVKPIGCRCGATLMLHIWKEEDL